MVSYDFDGQWCMSLVPSVMSDNPDYHVGAGIIMYSISRRFIIISAN